MTISDKCELIRRYILEKKGVDIVGIAHPRNAREWQLFERAWSKALMHYTM